MDLVERMREVCFAWDVWNRRGNRSESDLSKTARLLTALMKDFEKEYGVDEDLTWLE